MAFWFFLSTRFGRTVAELKAVMTYSEFVHHVAYHRLHPWGDDWHQAGTMAWAAVAPHTKRRMTPRDFMPKPQRQKPQSADYIFGVAKQLALDAAARRKAKSVGTEHQ